MKPPSFLLKVAVGNLLAVSAVMSLVGAMAYRYIDERYQSESRASQERALSWFQTHFQDVWTLEPQSAAAPTTTASSGDAGLAHQRDKMTGRCRQFAPDRSLRLTVIASDGVVLGDSEADPVTMTLHTGQNRPEIAAAMEGRMGQDTRVSETAGVPFRYMALPIRDSRDASRIAGIVRTAIPVQSIAGQSAFIRAVLWWASLAAVVATAILALLLSWWWYLPLRQVTQTARQIAAGDLSVRADGSWTAELAQLASALNEMRENLSRQMHLVESQREDLRTVVANAREGILAADAQGTVVLANDAAARMLSGTSCSPVGKTLAAAIDVLEIADLYSQARETSSPLQRQIEIQRDGCKKVLDVHAVPLMRQSAGIAGLLVAYDVTAIMEAASIRAEFAANASHELRTPLAVLRGSVEALERVIPFDAQPQRKFLDMMDRQVRRLEDLTGDLLSLHSIESGKTALRKECVELGSLAGWIEETYAERAAGAGLSLAVKCDDFSVAVESDPKLLELILQNLIDNAVKFTPAGGEVHCVLAMRNDALEMTVSDTGCGIPLELQSRVFERFFQVDPGRSGDPRQRGTGLGLAIVKHAAERLGGNVQLNSAAGRGTTVVVSVPQAT